MLQWQQWQLQLSRRNWCTQRANRQKEKERERMENGAHYSAGDKRTYLGFLSFWRRKVFKHTNWEWGRSNRWCCALSLSLFVCLPWGRLHNLQPKVANMQHASDATLLWLSSSSSGSIHIQRGKTSLSSLSFEYNGSKRVIRLICFDLICTYQMPMAIASSSSGRAFSCCFCCCGYNSPSSVRDVCSKSICYLFLSLSLRVYSIVIELHEWIWDCIYERSKQIYALYLHRKQNNKARRKNFNFFPIF